ncbi:MAG: SH3 domain-containing protein [Parvibaculaceae bacterium]
MLDLRRFLFAAAMALGLLQAAPALAAQAYTATDLNLRTGPGTEYDRILTIPANTGVGVLACQQGWCRVSAFGQIGWVSASYLAAGEDPNPVIVLQPQIYIGPGHYYRPPHYRPPHYRPPHLRPRPPYRPPHLKPRPPHKPGKPRPPRPPKPTCKIAPGFKCPS